MLCGMCPCMYLVCWWHLCQGPLDSWSGPWGFGIDGLEGCGFSSIFGHPVFWSLHLSVPQSACPMCGWLHMVGDHRHCDVWWFSAWEALDHQDGFCVVLPWMDCLCSASYVLWHGHLWLSPQEYQGVSGLGFDADLVVLFGISSRKVIPQDFCRCWGEEWPSLEVDGYGERDMDQCVRCWRCGITSWCASWMLPLTLWPQDLRHCGWVDVVSQSFGSIAGVNESPCH